jgi:2-isopropylmalate synthase
MNSNIIDCTLREGLQTKQSEISIEYSVHIAKYLEKFGVAMIECGHPAIDEYELNRVRAVVDAVKLPVLSHSRCRKEDIDAVKASGADWIGLFISINELSLKSKFLGKSRDDLICMFVDSIRYAKSLDLKIRATLEDSGRTALKDMVYAFDLAIKSGADRICIADSVGILLPRETFDLISLLSKEFSETDIEYHVHNDQGLALANSLEASRAGANWISASCNGVGERAGITDTIQFATLQQRKFNSKTYDLKCAIALSQLVQVATRIPISLMHPFIGLNCYVHKARLHQIAVKNNLESYTLIDPKVFGLKVEFAEEEYHVEKELFIQPFEKSSVELKYHSHGPGTRYVMLDKRLRKDSPFYFIARKVENVESSCLAHVEDHVHNCDSVFLFLGDGSSYTGVTVEVTVGDKVKLLSSPATVFIPMGVKHKYCFISGSGTFINFVHSGLYSDSLLEI